MYEIAVLFLACGGIALAVCVVMLGDRVRILKEEVKALNREMSNAFWKKVLQKEEEKIDS